MIERLNVGSEIAATRTDVISLLLVFVTVLFSLGYPEISDILEESIEKGKPKNLQKQLQTIQKGIWFV